VSGQLELGLLDLGKRAFPASAHQSLGEMAELARYAESLGYGRYWIAEHHTDDAAHSCPEAAIPFIASQTQSIRVGAAGILLGYYSPLKVAELFFALEALFPGRIDLGIARGPGVVSDDVALALVGGNEAELSEGEYRRKVADLQSYLSGSGLDDPRFSAVRARPLDVSSPPLWILGASSASLGLALEHSTRYGLSLFFGDADEDRSHLLDEYRARFAPSGGVPYAQAIVAVSIICAETNEEARRIDTDLTTRGYLPTNVVGTPAGCRAKLERIARRYGVNELVLATWPAEFEARVRTYELIARAAVPG
jgi:luciferase family oxidoreductase group 1